MRYFEDMTDKYGFSDGAAVPDGAQLYRKAYIIIVNTMAQELGSGVRLVAYDRAGFHNWCLVYFAPVQLTEAYTAAQLANGSVPDLDVTERTRTDAAMDMALELAQKMNIDEEYLTARISLSKQNLRAGIRNAIALAKEQRV